MCAPLAETSQDGDGCVLLERVTSQLSSGLEPGEEAQQIGFQKKMELKLYHLRMCSDMWILLSSSSLGQRQEG